MNARKQTESNTKANTKILKESSILNKDKIGSILISQLGNKNSICSLKMTINDKEYIRQILYTHFLFKYMNNKIITNLINNFELERFGPNHILYEENSEGDKFYIIKEGTLEEKFSNSPNIKKRK